MSGLYTLFMCHNEYIIWKGLYPIITLEKNYLDFFCF